MKTAILKTCFLVLTASLLMGLTQNFLERKEVAIGKPVPDFELKDAAGEIYRLSDLRGQHVMIHFWSATCPFVVRYEDRLRDITHDYKDQNVLVLGIDSNVNETPDQIEKVSRERNLSYPVLLDPDSRIADVFGAITTPHVFIVDGEGILVYEGSIDDQGWAEENPVTTNYAREVLNALVKGSEVPYTETSSFGCTVKRAL